MTVRAIIGLQWGDEGKGKIVDVLAEDADLVVRCQGGANAGHTVVIGDEAFALHLLPSGAVRDNVICVIGNGVVVNPVRLKEEVESLQARDIDILSRLRISDRAHILLPVHITLDGMREAARGKGSLGTTRQGIGPCYADKARRVGLRFHQAQDENAFRALLEERLKTASAEIQALGGEPIDLDSAMQETLDTVAALRPCITDTTTMLHEAVAGKKNILLEGAQGAMLDIDFGTYPFVTSSNTTIGGCCTGTGIPPTAIDEVHGIFKAFTTRVGAGPFVTELEGELAAKLRGTGENQWDEYGTTTGRPRRCGWLDLAVGRYSARVNGVTHLHVQKLDILGEFEELKVCTGYELDGTRLGRYPASLDELERVHPVYETLPGWQCEIANCTSLQDLPDGARKYVNCIAENIGASIATVSYGPGREQTIHFR